MNYDVHYHNELLFMFKIYHNLELTLNGKLKSLGHILLYRVQNNYRQGYDYIINETKTPIKRN